MSAWAKYVELHHSSTVSPGPGKYILLGRLRSQFSIFGLCEVQGTQHWDICIPIPNKYSLRMLHLLLPKALLCCTSQIFSIVYACCVMSDIWSILSLIQSAWSTVLHHLDVMGTSACMIYTHMQHYCSITNIMLCYLNTTILLEYRSFSSK